MKVIQQLSLVACTAIAGVFSMSSAFATPIVIGNTTFGGGVDSWQAIMVIDENKGYANTTGNVQMFNVTDFDFRVGVNRGQVTPFIVRVNDAVSNDYTLLAIGDTRISGVDYFSSGDFNFDFSSALSSIILNAGDVIAPGFLDADVAGNSSGSVIPFTGGASVFLSGHSNNAGSGNLLQGVGGAPNSGSFTGYESGGLHRNYSYNITLEERVSVPEPASVMLFCAGLIGLGFARRKHGLAGPGGQHN